MPVVETLEIVDCADKSSRRFKPIPIECEGCYGCGAVFKTGQFIHQIHAFRGRYSSGKLSPGRNRENGCFTQAEFCLCEKCYEAIGKRQDAIK
jgi:hypothetical protein